MTMDAKRFTLFENLTYSFALEDLVAKLKSAPSLTLLYRLCPD